MFGLLGGLLRGAAAGSVGASIGAGRAAKRAASQIASPITQPIRQFASAATSPIQTLASMSPLGGAAYDVAQSTGSGFSQSFSSALSKGTGKEPLVRVFGFEALLAFMRGQQESDESRAKAEQQRVRAEARNRLAGIEAQREFKLGGILKWAAIGAALIAGLKAYFGSKDAQDAVSSLAKTIVAPLLGAISSTASTIFSTLLSELDPSKW